jgi:translation initiation factor IF-1
MKIEPIKMNGLVLETLPSLHFKIQLENGKEIMAYLSGKMGRNKIRVLAGDKVVVEISPDTRISNCIGRIIHRS